MTAAGWKVMLDSASAATAPAKPGPGFVVKNHLSKAMGMIINLDNMRDGMFEKGLARLKEVVEKPATV